MRIKMAGTLALLACGLVGTAQDTKDGKYVSKEGGFAFRVPKGMSVKAEVETVMGQRRVEVTGGTGDRAYSVFSGPSAVDQLTPAVATKMFDGGIQSLAAESKGTEISRKDFAFGAEKHPASDFVVGTKQRAYRARAVLTPGRHYHVLLFGPLAFVEGKEADALIESFELIPPAGAKK